MASNFLGLQYPLVKGPRGLLSQKSGVDQIKSDLLQLLLTNPGERVMMPNFGTPLRSLFFEPNDIALTTTAKQMISSSILMWEPRIVVTDIQVSTNIDKSKLNALDTGEEKDAILFIQINFVDPQNISEIEQLTLTMPIGD